MKTSFGKLHLLAMAALLPSLLLPSCTDSSTDLISNIPSDAAMVVAIKPGDIFQKSDIESFCNKVVKSDNDKAEMNQVFELFGEDSGINMDAAYIFEHEKIWYVSFIIDDEEKFAKTEIVRDNTTKQKEKDFEYYAFDKDDDINIIVDGKKAWLAMNGDVYDAIRAIKEFTSLETENSILSKQAVADNLGKTDLSIYYNVEKLINSYGSVEMLQDIIDRELAPMGVTAEDLMIDQILTANVVCTWAIGKDDIKIEARIFDKNGANLLPKLTKTTATIDTGMLRFFDKSTNFVCASVIPDNTKKILKNMLKQSGIDETNNLVAKSLLDNIGDNMAFGMSLDRNFIKTETYYDYYSGDSVSYQNFNEAAVAFTAVVKCKKNMATELANAAAMMRVPLSNDGTIVIPVSRDQTFRVKADGNYIVVSNREDTSAPLSDPGFIVGKTAALFLNMTKNSSVSRGIKDAYGLDIDLSATGYSDKEKGVFELRVNNNEEASPIAYLLNMIADNIGKL